MQVIDLGDNGSVGCYACGKDYTTSDEPGGVLIGCAGYGPCCSEGKRVQARLTEARARYYWSPRENTITRCPEGMSFRAWMLSLR